jgi:peptidyl-prolyl cis-trans isomerase SDCCAG10
LLNKFKTKVNSAREQHIDNESSTLSNKNDEIEDDIDDPNDESWMVHALRCEEKVPVLAKDASTKGDDWFEIYDPRNPLNKRRRGETSDKSDKSKFDGRNKNRR